MLLPKDFERKPARTRIMLGRAGHSLTATQAKTGQRWITEVAEHRVGRRLDVRQQLLVQVLG